MPKLSLVADIGGTNSRFALADGTSLIEESILKYENAKHANPNGLQQVIAQFIEDVGTPDLHEAAIAIAGPVRDGKGGLTNLMWSIDEAQLAQQTGAKDAFVLNDLQAQGHALDHLGADAILGLDADINAVGTGTCLVIGIGTGFNCAPVFTTPSGRYVPPSEAGHGNMSICTEQQLAFRQFLVKSGKNPTVEYTLSGQGLKNCDAFIRDADDLRHTHAIFEAADAGEPQANAAIGLFISVLTQSAADLAMTFLPFGGVYFVGGMSRAITPYLAQHDFVQAIRAQSGGTGLLDHVPFGVVQDDFAALRGTAAIL